MLKYFKLLENIIEWQNKRQYHLMLEYCKKSIPLLKELVEQEIEEYGEFNISSIPAIEIGCRYWAALGDKEAIDYMVNIINKIPIIKERWSWVIERAYKDIELSKAIIEFIRNNPGTLQNRLGKNLQISGKDAGRIVNTLTNLNIIIRKPSKNTYELYVNPIVK